MSEPESGAIFIILVSNNFGVLNREEKFFNGEHCWSYSKSFTVISTGLGTPSVLSHRAVLTAIYELM